MARLSKLVQVKLNPSNMPRVQRLHSRAIPAKSNARRVDVSPKPGTALTPPKTHSSFIPPEPAATPVKVPEAPADRTERASQVYARLTHGARSRNDLLDKIWGRVRSEEKDDSLMASIMRLTHDAVDAEASSLLLLDDNTQELFFRFADGPVGQQLKRLHINRQSGIAGWIVRNGKPLLVNDPERNKNFYRNIDEATGFKTRAIIGVPIILNKKVVGVIEVLNRRDGKDFSRHDLKTMTDVAATTAIAIENSKMNAHLLNSYKSTVKAVVSLADARETSGGAHSRRVSEYGLIAAIEFGLSREEKQIIEYASILHDVGKLTISDNLLNKTQELTEDDWELIKKHPVTGFNLLKDIPFLREASRLILYHHERYDGRGYPEHLVGEDIPLGARIIAVADAFDNMTTAHPYRAAISRQLAFNELHKCAGTQFCPVAVKAFNAGFVKTRLSRK